MFRPGELIRFQQEHQTYARRIAVDPEAILTVLSCDAAGANALVRFREPRTGEEAAAFAFRFERVIESEPGRCEPGRCERCGGWAKKKLCLDCFLASDLPLEEY